MTAQEKSRTKQQKLVQLIEQSANRQHWNECRKQMLKLCKEVGQEQIQQYDPGTLENALTLLELIGKTGVGEERRATVIHALHRRLMEYLVQRSSPQTWPVLQTHLETGGLGYPLRAAIHTPAGEPCYRLRDVCLSKVERFR